MSTKYKFHDQDKLYFISFAVVNWIDLFIRKEYKDIGLAAGSTASNIKAWKYMAGAS